MRIDVILSAKESNGLEGYLKAEKYNIPEGAAPALVEAAYLSLPPAQRAALATAAEAEQGCSPAVTSGAGRSLVLAAYLQVNSSSLFRVVAFHACSSYLLPRLSIRYT